MDKNHLHALQNSITPKFIALISNPKKRQSMQRTFAILLPQSTLDISTEEYIQQSDLDYFTIIQNSFEMIEYSFDPEDIQEVSRILEPLSEKYSLRIIKQSDTPIFIEVVNILNYVVQIEKLIKSYPKRNANHYGTKHRSSSEKNLIKTHRAHLVERLDNPFFEIDDAELVELTKLQIEYIDQFQSKINKTLPEVLNWLENFIGLDNKLLALLPMQLKALKSVLSLFNGIRTSREKLLESVAIHTLMQSKLNLEDDKNNKIYADAIYSFINYMFNDIFIENSKKNKRTLTFNENTIIKPHYAKTVINDITIFAFTTGTAEDFIQKYLFEGLTDMAKIQSLDFLDDTSDQDISDYTMLRSFYKSFHEAGFSNSDINTMIKICQDNTEQSLLALNSSQD